MKCILVSLFLCVVAASASLYGQVQEIPAKQAIDEPPPIKEEPLFRRPNNYALGVGVGIATVYGDLNKHIPQIGARLGLGRHVSNSLLVGMEFYYGSLSSRETPNNWTTGLAATSRFYSIDADAKANLSVFFSNIDNKLSRILSGFYIGSGIGYVNTSVINITEVLRINNLKDSLPKNAIKKQEATIFLPLNIGFRMPLTRLPGSRLVQLMVNYNECYTNSNYINGYNLGEIKNNKSKRFHNVFGMLTIGFSFSLSGNKDPFSYGKHKNRRNEDNADEVENKGTEVKKINEKKPEIKKPAFIPKIID